MRLQIHVHRPDWQPNAVEAAMKHGAQNHRARNHRRLYQRVPWQMNHGRAGRDRAMPASVAGAGMGACRARRGAMPYEGAMEGVDSLALIARMLANPSSGIDAPAAFPIEPVAGRRWR